MLNIFKISIVLTLLILFAMGPRLGHAAGETDLADVLKKVDKLVCTQPQKITQFYSSKPVIMFDDKRSLLENRIRDYQDMISELQDMKCQSERKVLSGNVGDQVGYIMVDEMISVSSRASTDERQHSVCSYVFIKEKNQWKISHEHCSSLPDITIAPGDDALYYFHNPVY